VNGSHVHRLSVMCALNMIMFAVRAAPAEAHLNSTGMGPIYDGLAHFLMSPDDLVAALGLALLAGLRGATYGRRVLFVLPAAWLVGAALGVAMSTTTGSAIDAALWFLLLGGLVAADVQLSLRAVTALAGLLGLHHGFIDGAGMGQPGAATITVLGLGTAVFVLVTLTSAFVISLRAGWARIAVRVAGSWIAAVGLLMLGWTVRLHYLA
jgi:hydrogenase/urease accessory protein HupE